MPTPAIIAHRGGASRYPEQSMRGFREATASGFYPEMDIQFLSDGTPVLAHDEDVGRTMTGVTGAVSDLTPEQWRGAQIKSPTGGESAPPAFFEEVLDELGGAIVIVPEIKIPASDEQISTVLKMIADRELQKSVLMQCFAYDVSERVQEAGISALFLVGDSAPRGTLEEMLADDIGWLGPNREMPASDMATFTEAGIRVVPWTLNTQADAESLPDGIAGYFCDDPWA